MPGRSSVLIVLVMWILIFPTNSFEDYHSTVKLSNRFSSTSLSSPFTKEPISLFQTSGKPLEIGSTVLFQAYYWDPNQNMVPDNGQWWNMVKERIPEIKDAGFDSIWLPPPQKTRPGNIPTMGYEPYDYYDLGEYYQKNRTRTRYGTRQELQDLISEANSYGIATIADIVINHNVGGALEYNPFTDSYTPTNFMNISSGRFPRNYTHFWPNPAYGQSDTLAFGTFPDLIHANPYVHDSLIEWGKWLRDEIGYDGWRFDVAVGIIPEMLRDWMNEVGGWGVAEYWIVPDATDGIHDYQHQVEYLDSANNSLSAFDFELRNNLVEMSNGDGDYDMRNLYTRGLLWDNRTQQAVTVVSNHDTGRDERINFEKDKHMAYAYILTHEGYPSVYWSDYYDWELGPHVQNLVKIRNLYAKGSTTILYSDQDLYVMQRNGDPGLILGLNDHPSEWKEATITTKWKNTKLYEQSMQAENLTTDSDGKTTIRVPPRSYVIYAPDKPLLQFPLPPPSFDPNRVPLPTEITRGTPTIDGKYEPIYWNGPTYYDHMGDAGELQKDLSRLYLLNDDSNLYLALTYGKKLEPDLPLQFGIAISTKEGGATTTPEHSEIKYTLGSEKPEYIVYLTSNPSDPWNRFNTLTIYAYDESTQSWSDKQVLNRSLFADDPVLGFLELQIPLSLLDIKENSSISMKVFSTSTTKVAGFDSLPNDNTIRGSGDETSWITLPSPIFIRINKDTLPASTSPKKLENNYLWLLTIFPLAFFLKKLRRKRNIS